MSVHVCFRKRSEKSSHCGTGNEGLQKDRQCIFLQQEIEEGITEGTTRDEPANAQAQNGMSNQMGIHADDDSKDPGAEECHHTSRFHDAWYFLVTGLR